MHIDPFANCSVSRSKLGETLLRLRRHVDANRQREQASLELFQAWQARWSDHRELIARHLECLDHELSQLTLAAVPGPHLSLLELSTHSDDDAGNAVDSGEHATQMTEGDDTDGIIPSSNVRWHNA